MYVHRQEQVDTLVAELGDGLAASDVTGPVTIDETHMFFGHPYTYPLLLALQSEGIEFVFDDPINLRRFGEGRDVAGRQPTTLVLWHGTEAERRREDGSLVVAYADGLETVAVTLERP